MILFNGKINEWIKAEQARIIRSPHLFFAVLPCTLQEQLCSVLTDPDQLLQQNTIKLLKDTATTKAALVPVNGKSVFLKRTNQKNLLFTLRYLFRPARAFRAAVAASRVEQTGIRTPRVLAAGEQRSGLILKAGYLVTETEPDLITGSEIIKTSPFQKELYLQMLRQTTESAAKLHLGNILHNDMKFSNFYYAGMPGPDSKIGMLDLDSVQFCRSFPSENRIHIQLARILSSFYGYCDRHNDLPDQFPDLPELAELMTDYYHAVNPECQLSTEQIIRYAWSKWLCRAKLIHPVKGLA